MEEEKKSPNEHEKNGLVHPNKVETVTWPENLSVLDLSHEKISVFDENLKLPPNLEDLNLSHNNLVEIPALVLKLGNLKRLNVSFNSIQYFDATPKFLHSVEHLDISHNNLKSPPYWVWSESPEKLVKLDISCNPKITDSFENRYFEELIQYKTLVKEVKLYNCKLNKHLELLGTFKSAQVLEIGTDLTHTFLNQIDQIPCQGLDQCCYLQRLNLSNTRLYTIEANIDIYKDLIEISLSENNITGLPNEFCNLTKLETCILSGNSLLYLPEDIIKLNNLKRLHLDSNELCMLPERFTELDSLELLDLYNNCLCEVHRDVYRIPELDLAQNYMEEPESDGYLEAKERLRLNTGTREDGRKLEIEKPESSHSPYTSEDEEINELLENITTEDQANPDNPESEEDWDSDEYWVPAGCRVRVSPPLHPAWFYLVKQKMAQGNFCPMDLHEQPVHEKILMERKLNPKVWVEVEGQFDDLSEDES